jgi:ribosomal protein S12 methylthiotransferase accessory factor
MTGLAELVSPYVGVLRSLDELLVGPADARLPVYTCDPALDDRLLGGPLAVGGVCGLGLDRASAVGAALGEAAERYSLSYLPEERVLRRSARELPGAVDPARFGLFCTGDLARPGFPFVRFDADTVVPWIDGWDLATGELAWLPAELVVLADPIAPGGARIGYATSSGAACAPTIDEAAVRGLLELLERDAFMLLWAARISLPLLDWSAHPDLVELDRRYFRPSGVHYAAVDLSRVHGVPSVLGVVRAPASEPAVLGVGAGTATTIERAWWKALSEAFAARAAACRLALLGHGAGLADDGSDVRTFDDHIAFYCDERRAARTAFLDASPERRDIRQVAPLPRAAPETLAHLCDRLAAAGSSAYAVELTAPDVAELGVRVVKTVAPELCMLDVPHGARFRGNPRLLAAPHALELAAHPLELDELNPDPHPFP